MDIIRQFCEKNVMDYIFLTFSLYIKELVETTSPPYLTMKNIGRLLLSTSILPILMFLFNIVGIKLNNWISLSALYFTSSILTDIIEKKDILSFRELVFNLILSVMFSCTYLYFFK